MASVFKKSFCKPLPDGAKVYKRGERLYAQWTSGGKTYRNIARRDADGTVRLVYESPTYYFRYVDAASGRRIGMNTGCKVRDMAERVMRETEAEQERIRAGIIKPEQVKAAGRARQILTDVLELYCTYQRGKRKSEKHISETKNIIKAVADYCGWQTIGDMNRAGAETYLESRLKDGVSFRTYNKNRTALVAFGSWCVRKKHLISSPFMKMERMDEDSDRRYRRRPLSADEVRAIIEAARERPFDDAARMNRSKEITTDTQHDAAFWRGWNRAMAYRLMASTGLRWNECRTLTFADVHLDKPSHIALQAVNAKARRNACIPLCADILPELVCFIRERKKMLMGDSGASIVEFPGTLDIEPLFDLPVSIAAIFKVDCATAKVKTVDESGREKIEPVKTKDESGRVVDVHSLRHFYGTELARAGVPAYRLKELMRHSTIELTSKFYLHVKTKELQGDVNLLPSTMGMMVEAQAVSGADSDGTPVCTYSAQNSCFDVQNPALSCNSGDIDGTNKIPVHTGLSANKHGDIRKKEMVPRARIELATRGFSVRCSTN